MQVLLTGSRFEKLLSSAHTQLTLWMLIRKDQEVERFP